jgi:hypothetical protein
MHLDQGLPVSNQTEIRIAGFQHMGLAEIDGIDGRLRLRDGRGKRRGRVWKSVSSV